MPALRFLAIALAASFAAAPSSYAAEPQSLMVRVAAPAADPGRIDIVDAGSGKRIESLAMHCDRVHYGGGVIGCLRSVAGQGLKFDMADRQGRVQATLNFPNVLLASRVRVARNGAMAAFTGFSAGHTYIGPDFSTRTYLIDVARKRLVADVGTFRVIEASGLKLATKRINVWGVSFDPNQDYRFVATIGAGNDVFLAQGDIQARTLTLLRADMECPSFSPDGARIAFKRRNPAGGWFPAVYEIASGREWIMKDARSIDDQIEWLDNEKIVYELARADANSAETDVIVRSFDGKTSSRVLLPQAGSPARVD